MAYVDGFVAAVPTNNKDAYAEHAARSWKVFQKLGASATWECWGDEVPAGEVTSFPMAVQAGKDETVVFSWTIWPDKATRDVAWEKLMSDPDIATAMGEMPFDGKRMIYGGFSPILHMGAVPKD